MEIDKKSTISVKEKKYLQDKYVPKNYDLKIYIHGCKDLYHEEETNIVPFVEVKVN